MGLHDKKDQHSTTDGNQKDNAIIILDELAGTYTYRISSKKCARCHEEHLQGALISWLISRNVNVVIQYSRYGRLTLFQTSPGFYISALQVF